MGHLKRAVPSLRLLIARDALQNRSLLTLMRPLLILEMSTSLLLLLRGNWKLRTDATEISARTSASLSAPSRSLLLLLMRTKRIMSACRPGLTSSKERLRATRSRLKKQRKLLHSTLPSIAKLLEHLETLQLRLMPMSRLQQ